MEVYTKGWARGWLLLELPGQCLNPFRDECCMFMINEGMGKGTGGNWVCEGVRLG